MYLLLAVIEWGGEHFYFYVFVVIIAINLIMLHIFPNYIQPLFNKYTELEQGELREKIEALASKLNFPLTNVFVVD